jgi:MFS family permease
MRNISPNFNFVLYLIGRMVSDTGTGIQMMIMPLYIIDAGGSAATVGLFSFLALVPALLVFPFAGVLGDRLNRKTIMVITDFVSAVVILFLAFLSYSGAMSLTLLLGAQVIISLLNGLFDPATKGMLPRLVPQGQLTRANSKVASLRGLAMLLGPVIGAALYTRFGITMLFQINGISFLLSGISEILIRYTHVPRELEKGIRGIAAELSGGIGFILANNAIRRLCLLFLVVYALVQPIFSVALPLFYKSSLVYPDTHYGYLQSMTVLGMLLGSVVVGMVFGKGEDMKRPLKIGSLLLMVTMLSFALLMFPGILFVLGNGSIAYFVLLAGVLSLFSMAVMFINVPVQSFIQRETPNEYMSRVFSIVGIITRGGMPFGALVYGFALNRAEVHWTVLTAALLMAVVSFVFLSSLSGQHSFRKEP